MACAYYEHIGQILIIFSHITLFVQHEDEVKLLLVAKSDFSAV